MMKKMLKSRLLTENTGLYRGFGMLLVALSAGCGASANTTQKPADDSVEAIATPIMWNPPAQMVADHARWHDGSCSNTNSPPQRMCALQGQDFLLFHRKFTADLRAAYFAQNPGAAPVDPWLTVPTAIRNHADWNNNNLGQVEDNILNFRCSNTSACASLDAYGTYIETRLHGWLHTISGKLSPSDVQVNSPDTSPRSTIFLQIHGLVDQYLERWMRGGFNRDGRADLLVRTAGGAQVRLQQELTAGSVTTQSTIALPAEPATPSGQVCNWYTGAVADLNTDGWNDIVWHGPDCGKVEIWLMGNNTTSPRTNGTVNLTERISTVQLTSPGPDYRLIGAGDFTRDRHPDLAWTAGYSDPLLLWKMNRTTRTSSITVPLSLGRNTGAVLVGDFDDNGEPEILLKTYPDAGGIPDQYSIQYISGTTLGASDGVGSLNQSGAGEPVGFGRFSRPNRYPDLVFANNAGAAEQYKFGFMDIPVLPIPPALPVYTTSFSGQQATGASQYIQGPR